jgi:cobalt-zinc-cadmium efflux system membrane fusion protein
MSANDHKQLWSRLSIWIGAASLGIVVGGLGLYFFPTLKTLAAHALFHAAAVVDDKSNAESLVLLHGENGAVGLRLTSQVEHSFGIVPTPVRVPSEARPLPPQMGTLNYDYDRVFPVRPRFQGELVEIREVPEFAGLPSYRTRPLRFGDTVKQGDKLALLWCKDLGEKKAALVDAIINYRLSKDTVDRQLPLLQGGSLSLAAYKASEKQLQADANAVLTAERTLKIWKLTDEEIDAIKKEANIIHDQKKTRDSSQEKLWAQLVVTAPKFSTDSDRELVILEKNTSVGDLVDPGRDTPLFRLADLSRLQVWVHPPEEYLPLLREVISRHGPRAATWQIRFQADPTAPPIESEIVQISPSLDPNPHTPMLIGYLNNPDRKYLVGQFVTATIFVPPPSDTVQVPTESINSVEGQDLVFVADPKTPHEYFLRRLAVVHRFKDVTLVRSKLTPDDERLSAAEVARGRPPLSPLAPGEKVMNRGVIELTSALENLRGAATTHKD